MRPGPRGLLVAAPLQAVLLVLLGVLAYTQAFAAFAWYDDEGFMMLAVKHFLAGHRLYDDVRVYYGPVYFFYKWLLHGVLGLPLTHDVVRLTAMTVRVLIGVTAGVAAWSLTGSIAATALAEVLVVLHLTPMILEAGHPQELAGLLTIAVVATAGVARPGTFAALGVLVAVLAMLKVNLGILVGLAVWMTILSPPPAGAPGVALAVGSAAGAVLLPFAVMRPTLAQPWIQRFAVTESLSIAALAVVVLARRDARGGLRALAPFAVASAGGLAVITFATILRGSTPAGIIECLLAAPARISSVLVSVRPTYFPSVVPAGVGFVLALVARMTERARPPAPVVALAKLAFALLVFYGSWAFDVPLLLCWLTPFLWLAVLPPEPGSWTFARLLLCWVAVLEPLQAYPVSGSQVYFGTVLHVLVGVVCLADALAGLSSLSPRPARVAAAVALVLIAVGIGAVRLAEWRRASATFVPLDLPGSARLRVSPADAGTLRALTRTLRERADTFVSVPGFNSLYFWTLEEPPTLALIGHDIRLEPEAGQSAMLSALLAHPRPMVVHFDGFTPPYPPFEERLARSFKPALEIGAFRLLVPR